MFVAEVQLLCCPKFAEVLHTVFSICATGAVETLYGHVFVRRITNQRHTAKIIVHTVGQSHLPGSVHVLP